MADALPDDVEVLAAFDSVGCGHSWPLLLIVDASAGVAIATRGLPGY